MNGRPPARDARSPLVIDQRRGSEPRWSICRFSGSARCPVFLAGLLGIGAVSPMGQLTGRVCRPAAVPISLSSVLCAPVGVAIAHGLPTALLKRTFTAVLLLIGLATLLEAFRDDVLAPAHHARGMS